MAPLRPEPEIPRHDHVGGCQIGDLFQILSKAHMLPILYLFLARADGALRFKDLQDELRISPNTLSERLRELTAAGLVTRTAYNEIPPRVDYEATTKARDLCTVFDALGAWAERHSLAPEPVAAVEA